MLTALESDERIDDQMVSNSLALSFQRDSFYLRRTRWSFDLFSRNRLVKPDWVVDTPFQFIYDEAPELIKRGTIVWAYIVQVFDSGPSAPLAFVLFGIEEYSNNLNVLKPYADKLLQLMDSTSRLPSFINSVTSPKQPGFNKKLPSSIAPDHKIFFTTTIIHRKYLPSRKLRAHWFPLTNQSNTD